MAAVERDVSGVALDTGGARGIGFEEDRDTLHEEGERLVRFVAEPQGAETFEVRFQ